MSQALTVNHEFKYRLKNMRIQRQSNTRPLFDPSRIGLPSSNLVDRERRETHTIWRYEFPNGHKAKVTYDECKGVFEAHMTDITDGNPYIGTDVSRAKAFIEDIRMLPDSRPEENVVLGRGLTMRELLGDSYRKSR